MKTTKEQPKIKSSNSFTFHLIVYLIGGIGSSTAGYKLLSQGFGMPYPQLPSVVLGTLFSLFGIVCILAIYNLDSIYVYSDRFEIKSIFGNTKKEILLQDITTWTEIEKENKHTKWTDLTIYTEKEKYKIYSNIYDNYLELKRSVTRGKVRDLDRQRQWFRNNDIYFGIGMLIVGSVFLLGAYYSSLSKDKIINTKDLHQISGITISKPEKDTSSRSSGRIRVKLSEYPAFHFDISRDMFATEKDYDYIQTINIGDTLVLNITKEEYETKLTKDKPLGFWDKTVNYPIVAVYGLRDKNRSLLNLSGYNAEAMKDKGAGLWFFGFIGLSLIGYGIYLFMKQ